MRYGLLGESMKIIVQKYGGKSVGTLDRIKDVAAQIVERHSGGERLVVVVSAMGHTTDKLLADARKISSNPSERELDMLLTAGERISMALLSMAICDMGCNAISFTGSQSGIITDDKHTRAKIIEIRALRIIEELQHGKIVIVAGFQGVSGYREVTTLGRGGSDTTAVALACALGGERCEIYSDVDGLYSADPKTIAEAIPIAKVDYETLFDLTFYGSRVVHSRAIELARKFKIPLLLASSIKPGRDTMVKSIAMEGAAFTAVASQPEIGWASVKMPESTLNSFWNELDRMRTGIRNPTFSMKGDDVHLNFWVYQNQMKEIDEVFAKFPNISAELEKLALVALSGYALTDSAESTATVIGILSQAGIKCRSLGSTNRSIYVIVERADCEELEKIFHRKLISK